MPLATFLDNHLRGTVNPIFPKQDDDDDAGVARLRSLYVHAMRLAEDYAIRALRMLMSDDDVDAVYTDVKVASARDLQAVRLTLVPARTSTAFFRFELSCRVFPPRKAPNFWKTVCWKFQTLVD